MVCGIYFPDQGSNPGCLPWDHRVLADGAPGKSLNWKFHPQSGLGLEVKLESLGTGPSGSGRRFVTGSMGGGGRRPHPESWSGRQPLPLLLTLMKITYAPSQHCASFLWCSVSSMHLLIRTHFKPGPGRNTSFLLSQRLLRGLTAVRGRFVLAENLGHYECYGGCPASWI